LLSLLRSAANSLDELAQLHGMPHLAINPRNLLVRDDHMLLFEYGLVPLLLGAQGKPAGTINVRYAAPELFEKTASKTADQYSLALVYAEMLSGHHPRPSRVVSRPGASKTAAKLDLSMLPAFDRDIVTRALNSDPTRRFGSCREFIRALEDAGGPSPDQKERYRSLPAIVSLANLRGEPSRGDTLRLPGVDAFVTELILTTANALKICEYNQLRYLILPGNTVEHRCPIRMIPGGLRLKLHDFAKQYTGMVVRQDDSTYQCRIPASRNLWQRCFGGESGMEVHVLLQPLPEPIPQMVEAVVRVHPYGSANARLTNEITQIGPNLIESVRTYLQAEPDQRGRERWPCQQPVHVYPVYPDLQVGNAIEGMGKNVSLAGVGLRLPEAVPTEYAYVTFPAAPITAAAVLGRVVRTKPGPEGAHDVGIEFPTDTAPNSNGQAALDSKSK
jgi:hypothetical protein